MRRAWLASLALGALTLAGAARADTPPSPWEIAKDPRARETWAVHAEYERLMTSAEAMRVIARAPMDNSNGWVLKACGVLEDADARHSSDPRLVFDLGTCLEDHRVARHIEAAEVLGEALRRWPDHPMAEAAWLEYAFANARLERPLEERRAYEKFLALATEPQRRLVPMLNMAEADMRAGDLATAVAGYRGVLQDAAGLPNTDSTVQTTILAKWGLAVALDRQGDVFGAQRTAKQATEMDGPPDATGTYARQGRGFRKTVILDQESVFFVPAYERNWYLALGEAELAKAEADPRKALEHWRATEAFWTAYVAGARGAKVPDRWVDMADKHLAQTKARRADAQARVAKLPAVVQPTGVFID